MRGNATRLVLRSAALCVCLLGAARGSALLSQSNIVGLPTVAAPVQYSFSVTGAAVVTLKDLATPAAFTALQMAVTSNDALIGTPASIDSTTNTATLNIPAAGTYVLYVVGLPNAAQGFGSFGVTVALQSAPTVFVAQYSGNITTPSTASTAGTSTVTTYFNAATAGTYTVTLTDDQFPTALDFVSASVFQDGAQIGSAIQTGTSTPVTSTQITLAAGATQLLIAAQASTTTVAGLYGVLVTDPNGSPVFDHSYPVGTLAAPTVVNNPSSQSLALTLSDEGYPSPLATVGAAVTSGGSLLGVLNAAGTNSNLLAAPGSLDVWTYAAAGAEPGVYSLSLSAASGSLLSTTQVVNPSSNASGDSYAYIVALPAAGTYQLVTTDLQFPTSLNSLVATVGQDGAALTLSSTGEFTAAAGSVTVLVTAAPSGASGTFDVTVQSTAASPQVVYEQTQAVGTVLNSQTINVGTTGNYEVTLSDLGFPQNFSDLAVFVSQGNQVLGKVYGAGNFQFPGTAGDQYLVTIVATPAATAPTTSASTVPGFGLYALDITPVPTVSLTSSASTVTSGGSVTLTWSSQNATSCTASGGTGWSGSESTSGSLALVVTSTETLVLDCTGAGGSGSSSVTITATAASHSGGGAMDPESIIVLLGLWGLSSSLRRRPSPTGSA